MKLLNNRNAYHNKKCLDYGKTIKKRSLKIIKTTNQKNTKITQVKTSKIKLPNWIALGNKVNYVSQYSITIG